MCTYVLCTCSPSPHPSVCVGNPGATTDSVQPGEGTEGNRGRGNWRGREPGVLIQTHRRARGGATGSRATCITRRPPPPVSPQLLPRQQEEPRASPGTASPSCCPGAAGDRAVPEGGRSAGVAHATVTPPSLQAAPSTARGWAVPRGQQRSSVVSLQPRQWHSSLHRGTAGSRKDPGAATVRAHWPSPLPPSLW